MEINDLPAKKDPKTKQVVAECPKCGATSGDDWSQCEGFCPITASPHYSFATEATYSR